MSAMLVYLIGKIVLFGKALLFSIGNVCNVGLHLF